MGYIGYQLGLSAELIKLVSLIAGFFVSFRTYQGLGDALASRSFLSIEWASALMMMGLVLVIYGVITRLLRLGEQLVQVSFQTRLNQLGGLVAGVVRAGLVMSIILVALEQVPSSGLRVSIEDRSMTGSILAHAAPVVYDSLLPVLRRSLESFRVLIS